MANHQPQSQTLRKFSQRMPMKIVAIAGKACKAMNQVRNLSLLPGIQHLTYIKAIYRASIKIANDYP
jgi:hypothetical protein